MDIETDKMWPHFAPLWTDLRSISDQFVLAGGYGLFLKQRWLLANEDVRSIIAWDRWRDATPRVTKDLDLVVSVDLIASKDTQPKVTEILARHEYQVVDRHARWQFEKKLSEDRSVLIDLHSPLPTGKRSDIRVEALRVKPHRSLGKTGIHGRQNPEAIGCALHPFKFELQDLTISVPNPLAWSMMKLIAMRDRWESSQDTTRSAGARESALEEAMKHAQDLCRSVAMATQDEFANAEAVAQQLRAEQSFEDAKGVHAGFFKEQDGRGCNFVRDRWADEAMTLIRETLTSWYS